MILIHHGCSCGTELRMWPWVAGVKELGFSPNPIHISFYSSQLILLNSHSCEHLQLVGVGCDCIYHRSVTLWLISFPKEVWFCACFNVYYSNYYFLSLYLSLYLIAGSDGSKLDEKQMVNRIKWWWDGSKVLWIIESHAHILSDVCTLCA